MQFPLIILNKTIIRVLLSVCVIHYYMVWWHIALNILRVTATYEWKVEDLSHTCVDVYVITWLRGIDQRSECLQERVTRSIHTRSRLYFKRIFHVVVIK